MYANFDNEKKTLPNDNKKLSHNQFTKSLTSFHTKKTLSKNIINQNQNKKTVPVKQEKTVKNKRIYLSR
jgi:hypothetical protein